jgi:hypothetical protein
LGQIGLIPNTAGELKVVMVVVVVVVVVVGQFAISLGWSRFRG